MRFGTFISRRRLLGGALLASLTLNAFFIGGAVTDLARMAGVGEDSDRAEASATLFRYDWRWLDGRLPDDAMAKIRADAGTDMPGAERRFEHLHELRTSLGMLVAAPKPDRVAIDAKLAEIRTELDRLLAETQATTIASVLSLPAQTRTNLGAPASVGP
jgi:Heavy-metal resistance